MRARKHQTEGTIVAIATPPGEGGIGVVRLSGERALEVAAKVFRPRSGGPVSAQKNFTSRYGHAVEGEKVLDEVLLLVMRGPKSYTGEDTAEISAHGGPAVLQAIVRAALGAGARLAEPGEFTKRAFLNGRMDLVQAEAVLDLIRARTERERVWALSQLEGELSKRMQKWKQALVEAASHLEASIDFPDDSPETDPLGETRKKLEALSSDIAVMLRDSELAFSSKRGVRITLWGRPNVGKSSLMNKLTRSERVIVTPYPGTTRDVVEEQSSLGDFTVRYQDTAGVRETEHPVEKEGVERSKKAMAGADLVLLVLDSSEALKSEDRALFSELGGKSVLVALNKGDLPARLDKKTLERELPQKWPVIPCSCIEKDGTQKLEQAMLSLILNGRVEMPQGAVIGTARQRDLLEKVSKELGRACEGCRQSLSDELIASDVRQALDHLGELVGEVYTDDILDLLFKQFCIGK